MNNTPLRYPGGKSSLYFLIEYILEKQFPETKYYIEPFVGGGGIAFSLLLNQKVDTIIINDYDKAIYSFWRAVIEDTTELIYKIQTTPLSVDEWKNQQYIYRTSKRYSVEFAFSTFYLNRTNRSGILNAGPIGGYGQSGKWKLDARFNKEQLIQKIEKIAKYKSNIILYNKDIRSFLKNYFPKIKEKSFTYFDPPYFNKGNRLYRNYLTKNDHKEIADVIEKKSNDWIVTYDDVEYLREVYQKYFIKNYYIKYSAAQKKRASEIMIFSDAKMYDNIVKDFISKNVKIPG